MEKKSTHRVRVRVRVWVRVRVRVTFGNKERKLSIFADDLTAFQDKSSYENLILVLKDFENCAGLKVNKEKTEAFWLGRDHNNPPTVITI